MATLIQTPFPIFTDTDGLPLENGYIDIGVAGLNPLSNPRQAYWDEALTLPAANIRTTRGYPARNGAAAFLYTAPGDFSIVVRDKNGSVILSNLTVIDQLTVLENRVLAIETDLPITYAPLASPAFTGAPTAPTPAPGVFNTGLATTEFVAQNLNLVGQLIMTEFEETTSADLPLVPRNIDNDLDVANWPLLVPKLRSVKAKVLGVTDHVVACAGAIATFPNTTEAIALLGLLVNDAIVANYMDTGEPANFAGGASYSIGTARRSINIAGTDYPITGVNAALREVTFSTNPPAGAQTASCYTYRISGSTTTARLLCIAGFVGVAAGDAGGEVVGGFRKMDRGQSHRHGEAYAGNAIAGRHGSATVEAGAAVSRYSFGDSGATNTPIAALTSIPYTDSTNGTPRTGKTTDPRTAGQYAYTWGAQYIP